MVVPFLKKKAVFDCFFINCKRGKYLLVTLYFTFYSVIVSSERRENKNGQKNEREQLIKLIDASFAYSQVDCDLVSCC